MASILIVEDEQILREAFTLLLQANGYQVDAAHNGQAALGNCAENTYDLILLDIMMPVLDGIGFLRQAKLQTAAPNTRVIVLSNLSYDEMPAELQQLGVHRQEIKANLSSRDIVMLVRDELEEGRPQQPVAA